ncbi:MAG: competence/damage-inducible protein A [Fimbriimonadaceae bacterium]|nr:competence/damage-inducible protein A [Fimbriimonadaceae bacterium]
MTAEVVSVGTELLLGDTVDTNAVALGRAFAAAGLSHFHRQTVGDNPKRLRVALDLAFSRSDLVVTIGGLGPTSDDITRELVCDSLGLEMVEDEEIVNHLKSLFRTRGRPWVETNARQAMRPAGSTVIANANGTAPGLVVESGGKMAILMPGPPSEFLPMLTDSVAPILARIGGGELIHSRVLRVVGRGESQLEQDLSDLMVSENPSLAPYAKTWEVHLRLTARANSVEEAKRMIAPLEALVRGRIGEHIYGADKEELEDVVLSQLRSRAETLAVAESCTGGGLGERLTRVAGASDVFQGGVISYANSAKVNVLGVLPEDIAEHGAVSERVACEMARGARDRLHADWGISITGVAGPDGGTLDKPVGTVWIGLAGQGEVAAIEHRFGGTRTTVRSRSQTAALTTLWRRLR